LNRDSRRRDNRRFDRDIGHFGRREARPSPATLEIFVQPTNGGIMWWGVGIGGFFLYLVFAFTLGLMTLRNGHGWMFFFGIFFPILWIFGAFMRPPEAAATY
jgi:hypothetical protein